MWLTLVIRYVKASKQAQTSTQISCDCRQAPCARTHRTQPATRRVGQNAQFHAHADLGRALTREHVRRDVLRCSRASVAHNFSILVGCLEIEHLGTALHAHMLDLNASAPQQKNVISTYVRVPSVSACLCVYVCTYTCVSVLISHSCFLRILSPLHNMLMQKEERVASKLKICTVAQGLTCVCKTEPGSTMPLNAALKPSSGPPTASRTTRAALADDHIPCVMVPGSEARSAMYLTRC